MKILLNRPMNVDIKYLHLFLKVGDEFYADLEDCSTNVICSYEGYVPVFMPGEHFGDYVDLVIDVETGQIINWVKPTPQQIKHMVEDSTFESEY